MPRTKATKKKQPPAKQSCEFALNVLNYLETYKNEIDVKLDATYNQFLSVVSYDLQMAKLQIPKQLLDKTIAELKELPLNWSGNTTTASIIQASNVTKTDTQKRRPPVTRSSSFGDDEGYLTAESSNGTSGSRRSRTRNKTVQKSTRVSRSCSSRGKLGVVVPDKFKTPAQKITSSTYGMVTPKVKPNTPQVLLRRPKQGEVAISLQGSPLFTGPVASENVANVNIPLDDGRVFSIQPQRGLRISQIPQLDLETQRQLETLRDNLNKVCAIASSTGRH